MPVELQVIRASEFIRLDPHEHLDFLASRQALQDIAHACQMRGLESALLDLRALSVPDKPKFTATELAALVGTFRDAGFGKKQRLAILYRVDVYGGVRNFAFISRLRGMQVRAFEEFESALNWLSEGHIEEEECPETAVPVPIMKRKPETKRSTK
jgi:hypothetical protein